MCACSCSIWMSHTGHTTLKSQVDGGVSTSTERGSSEVEMVEVMRCIILRPDAATSNFGAGFSADLFEVGSFLFRDRNGGAFELRRENDRRSAAGHPIDRPDPA